MVAFLYVRFQKISTATPRMVIGDFEGEGGGVVSKWPKIIRESIPVMLNWKFKGAGEEEFKPKTIPGKVWIFFGTTLHRR